MFLFSLLSLCPAPQYVSPFSVDSNLTVIWLDWAGSFSLNGYLKEYSVTESQLRVYTGFYSYLHIPRTSQKSKRAHTHTYMYISTYKFIQHTSLLVSAAQLPLKDKILFKLIIFG